MKNYNDEKPKYSKSSEKLKEMIVKLENTRDSTGKLVKITKS